MALPWLDADPQSPFPSPETALRDPDGLLAAGGDLSIARLLNAYRHGVFPWFSEGQPPLWWCPDPRTVFRTDRIAQSRRFRRRMRNCDWVIRADTAFAHVIARCATIPRAGQPGTWITDAMRSAYTDLHRAGHAHSIEVFADGDCVGGLYGVAIGRMFFGESMYSERPDASKVALAALGHVLGGWGWPLVDAQVENPHLLSLGAELWPRTRFLSQIAALVEADGRVGPWTERFGPVPARVLGLSRNPAAG